MGSLMRNWSGILVAFFLLALMPLILPLPFATEVLIFAIYTMGCNFLLGRVGLLSFGQPAYLAVGAYFTGLYLSYWGGNPYMGILAGVVGSAVFCLIVGPFFVRLRSDYFALVNLALCVIIYFLFEKVMMGITHGDEGLSFLMKMNSTPLLDLTSQKGFFIFTFLVTLLVWVFCKYVDNSVYGAACMATKINEDRLIFLGYSAFRVRWSAFVIANTMAALAGSLYAVWFGYVSPDMSAPARAADVVVVTILGGVGTLYGPLVGSFAYIAMKDLISSLITNWELFIGLLLVFIMLAGEKGIWGSLEPVLKKFALKRKMGASTRT
jgi:branched-chain amino acid transport system permease protein